MISLRSRHRSSLSEASIIEDQREGNEVELREDHQEE